MAKGGDRRATVTESEKAYQLLKKAIVKGEMPEGVFLSETEITARYKIGRTPYREACSRLHHDGLLEVVPRKGSLVPEMSFHTVRDLFEARQVIEGSTAELAVLRATETEIDELEAILIRATSVQRPESDFEHIVNSNAAFHIKLAEIARNRELLRQLTSILERIERVMFMELHYSRSDGGHFKMIHTPIVAAVRKRNAKAAREAILRDIVESENATFGRQRIKGSRQL